MKRGDLSIVAVTTSHGIMHAYLVVMPALMPLMAGELGGLSFLAYMASLVTLFYGWGSFPVGFLADVISRKKLITLSMMVCGVASIIVGFSWNIWVTGIGMILIGIGASLYHPPGYAHMALLSIEMRGSFISGQVIVADGGRMDFISHA